MTVNVGKADMGQHVASTMAQIVADELGAPWSAMRVSLVGNDPKYNDLVLGANITGSWSTMMNFEQPAAEREPPPWVVKAISRSQWNAGYGADTGTSRGDPVGPLSAQLRRPRPRSATSAYVEIQSS